MTLTELFNPSFFMLLGILLLAISFLIFYFENKMREQNHKINSMFSLVSSITEELNNANMRIHYMMNGTGGEGSGPVPNSNLNIHSVKIPSNTFANEKIEVSDDDSEGDDDDDDDDDENDDDDDNDDDDEDNDDDDEDNDDENDEEDNEAEDIDTEGADEDNDDDKTYYQGKNQKIKPVIPTLEELSDLDEDDSMNGIEDMDQNENNKKVLLMESELPSLEESTFSSDLKSIHISLDHPNDSVDHKKLSVTQLRNLVVKKGLASLEEANKMKKGDLHKLL